jgi:hypothetical protein
MRISCKTRSAHMEETPVSNAKRRATALGGSSGAGVLYGAWCIMAAKRKLKTRVGA